MSDTLQDRIIEILKTKSLHYMDRLLLEGLLISDKGQLTDKEVELILKEIEEKDEQL